MVWNGTGRPAFCGVKTKVVEEVGYHLKAILTDLARKTFLWIFPNTNQGRGVPNLLISIQKTSFSDGFRPLEHVHVLLCLLRSLRNELRNDLGEN